MTTSGTREVHDAIIGTVLAVGDDVKVRSSVRGSAGTIR